MSQLELKNSYRQINSVPTGALATVVFGMSLRDASLVILFFSILTCIPPAFMGLGGYKTGLRQLVQARYSFGYVKPAKSD